MSAQPDFSPVFRRIRGGNAFEETVERLLQAVKLGQVRPGERLPTERELAASLGVSRVTLREALRALAQAGYFESRRGRAGGTFVLPSQEWRRTADVRTGVADRAAELADVLALRHVLETGAVELAASRAHPPSVRASLERMLAEERVVGLVDCRPADYRPLDSRLHVALASLAGSPSLTAAVADVRMRVNDLLDAIPLLPRNIAHATAQHERIVAAVVAGRPRAARTAMVEHLEGTASLLRGFLG